MPLKSILAYQVVARCYWQLPVKGFCYVNLTLLSAMLWGAAASCWLHEYIFCNMRSMRLERRLADVFVFYLCVYEFN